MPLRSKTYLISIHALREEGDSLFSSTSTQTGRISIHALREEGDACFPPRPRKQGEFLSTPSARRATSIPRKAFEEFVFLSTPSARRATYPKKTGKQYALFLSTPSARRATQSRPTRLSGCPYFYPRPPRGGRRPLLFGRGDTTLISIHALREEGDIRCSWSSSVSRLFLSTPSARRATPKSRSRSLTTFYFYPRPPRGGRRCQSLQTT